MVAKNMINATLNHVPLLYIVAWYNFFVAAVSAYSSFRLRPVQVQIPALIHHAYIWVI